MVTCDELKVPELNVLVKSVRTGESVVIRGEAADPFSILETPPAGAKRDYLITAFCGALERNYPVPKYFNSEPEADRLLRALARLNPTTEELKDKLDKSDSYRHEVEAEVASIRAGTAMGQRLTRGLDPSVSGGKQDKPTERHLSRQ